MRVLIVDDNHDNADTMRRIIELTFKHTVKVAYDGLSGIALAVEFQPDIILMDIGMPGINGYDTAKLLRKWYCGKLICVSGWGTQENITEALTSGFDEHVHKPITMPILQRLLG